MIITTFIHACRILAEKWSASIFNQVLLRMTGETQS